MATATDSRDRLLIEPTKLPNDIGEFVVLDARDGANYAELHAKDARWFDAVEWGKAFDNGQDAPGWSKRIGELGIDGDTKVVVYDDNDSKDAARSWWILKYWGVKDVRIVNGGWPAWRNARAGYGSGTPVPPTPKAFKAVPVTERIARKDELISAIRDKSWQIVDARSMDEHCGADAKSNKRAGAMPGAKHLEWKDLLAEDGRFLSTDELQKLFAAKGIALDQPTVTHCQGGARAAVMAFAMELVGAGPVRNYYRSWGEWGNAADTPIVKPR